MKDPGNGGTAKKVATINRNLALLKAIFSLGMRKGWIERNPGSLIKLEKENNARDRVLDPEEFTRYRPIHSALHLQIMHLCVHQTEDTKTDDAHLIPLTHE